MADAIALLEAAQFSKSSNESWFMRIRTLSTWLSVKDDGAGREVVFDRDTNTLVVAEEVWEVLILETYENVVRNQPANATLKLITKATGDELSETHSMNGRRFGIPGSFVKAVVSRIHSPTTGRQGTADSVDEAPKPSLTSLDIHIFLNVAKTHSDDGWTPQLVIEGE